MQTWSDLLPEILNKIAGKLTFYEDFINFLCVCSSWRSSITTPKNLIQLLPSRYPLLMLAESNTVKHDEQLKRRLYLLSNGGTMLTVELPEAHRQRCISANGWLLTTGEEEFTAKLINPLSRTRIDLPELYMFEELYFEQDEWMYYGQSMRKVVCTSSDPLSDPSFRVVILWGETIGFCSPGDVSWTRVNGSEGRVFDIMYHRFRNRLYIADATGSIYECDIYGGGAPPLTLRPVSTFPGEEFNCRSPPATYVLEWGNAGLLMVTRERQFYKKDDGEYGRYGPYRTCRFRCFVFTFGDGVWSEVVSLGDKAAFLGFNSSFAIDAGGGVKANCIYFTDDLYEPYRDLPDGGGGDVGVYHMSDGSIDAIFESQESFFRGSPLWLQTSSLVPT